MPKQVVTPEMIQEMRRLRALPMKYEDIGLRVGCSRETVRLNIGDGRKIGKRKQREGQHQQQKNRVTDADVAKMLLMRRDGKSYAEIAELVNCSPATVSRRVGDGRRVAPTGRNPNSAQAKRQRKWRANRTTEQREKALAYSRQWKIDNKERVRAYDRERAARIKHERNGSPPPKNGRTCTCPAPLGEQGEPCGWCSYLIRADAA